jgi:hypothetical protein
MSVLLDSDRPFMLFEPILGDALLNLIDVGRPWFFCIEIQVAWFVILLGSALGEVARFKEADPTVALALANAVVFLATFAAENHREEDFTGFLPRDKPLSIDRKIATLLVTERRIDRIATTDELVEPEGE